MKTTTTFILILVCLILSNCTQVEKKSTSFTLHGKIIGQDSGRVVMQYGLFSSSHKDIAQIINGNFTFTGTVEEPTRARINGGDELNMTEIYLEPGVMNATLIKDRYKEIKLTGSISQIELNELNKLLETSKNPDSVLLTFVSKNPKSYLTPFYLQVLDGKQAISLDSLKTIYNGLDTIVKASRYGRWTKGIIRKYENTRIGGTASEFKATDLNNQPITLSQFKGKNVVLLDFWNSPCGWCRKGMPHLIKLYDQYHPKGLEIIAVNCIDLNRDAWLSAINLDSIKMFHHVQTFFLTGDFKNEDIIFDYPVFGRRGLPQAILINRDGKVIGHWDGYSPENAESLDIKMAEAFNN